LVIGFIGHLQIVITINYSAVANSHALQFTIARTKHSVCCIFTGCRLLTASNIVKSSAFLFTSLLAGDYLTIKSFIQLSPRLTAISYLLVLLSLSCQDSHLMATGPRYIASVRAAQRTPFTTAILLLRACLSR
jgi:hypothetical protein